MQRQTNRIRNQAQLVGYDTGGRAVIEVRLPLTEYYEELHPLIDDASYRMNLNVARVTGVLNDSSGEKTQEFEIRYSIDGNYLSSVTRHSDGTVVSDAG